MAIQEITSPHNSKVKEWRTLLSGKGIGKHRKALVSGGKIVADVIDNVPENIKECIINDRSPAPPVNLPKDVPAYNLKGSLFRELDVFGTGFPLLTLDVPEILPVEEYEFDEPATLLIPFQDPANLGAVVRSAAAFGVNTVVLLDEAASPFLPKSVRASGSYVFSVKFFRGGSLYDLGGLPVPVIALSSDGVDIARYVFPDRWAMLVGIEGQGIPGSFRSDVDLAIPLEDGVESLNAAVAASIALYEWKRCV